MKPVIIIQWMSDASDMLSAVMLSVHPGTAGRHVVIWGSERVPAGPVQNIVPWSMRMMDDSMGMEGASAVRIIYCVP